MPLLTVVVMLAACGQAQSAQQSDPTPPTGWSWYHDSRFPFRVPVPQGWQAITFTRGYAKGQECVHVVALVPPGTPHDDHVTGPAFRVPEVISIQTMVDCPEWTPSDNRNYQPIPGSLVISGAEATFYGYETPGVGISRMAVTHFGNHQYLLTFDYEDNPETSPADRQQQDLERYMQVLKSFAYTGS